MSLKLQKMLIIISSKSQNLRERFHKAIQSREIRRLGSNILFLTIARAIGALSPFIIIWHFLKILSVDQYGVLVLYMSCVQFGYIFAEAGLTLPLIEKLANGRSTPGFASLLLSTTMLLSIGISIVYSLLCLSTLLLLNIANNHLAIFLWLPLGLSCLAMIPNWLFLGREDGLTLAKATFASKLMLTLAVLYLLDSPDDVYLYPLIDALANLAIVVFAVLYARNIGLELAYPTRRLLNYISKMSRLHLTGRISVAGYQNSPVIILSYIANPATVGLYGIADQIYKGLNQLFSPVVLAAYPYLVQKRSIKPFFIVLGTCVFSAIIIAIVVRLNLQTIIGLIGAPNSGVLITTTNILLIGFVLNVLNSFCGYPLFAALGRVKIASSSLVYGGIVYIGMMPILMIHPVGSSYIAFSVVMAEIGVLYCRLRAAYRISKKGVASV